MTGAAWLVFRTTILGEAGRPCRDALVVAVHGHCPTFRVVHNRRYFPSLMTYAESMGLCTYDGRVAFASC